MTPETEERLVAILEQQKDVLEKLERRLAETAESVIPIAEAMKRLGCGRTRVFTFIKEGKLVKVKHGKDTFVTVESVDVLNGSPGRSIRR